MSEIKKDLKKEMQEDYPLIPMGEITDEARMLAKTWYDGVSEMNNIWDKHKLASDIMNYARRFAMSPEARRMNGGWVRVEDRLPDFNERVFILTNDIWRDIGKFTGSGWYYYSEVGLIPVGENFTITHWQPLPEPPVE